MIAGVENFIQMGSNTLTTEEELRVRFGLAPRVLAGIRQLELREGEHWKKEGRVICYTPEGVEFLRDRLALVEKKGAPDPPPAGPEATPPAELLPMSITLTRVRLRNTRIVLGRKTGSDASTPEVRVRVRTSQNLRIGMVLAVCHPADPENGLWEFRSRLPRFPGKW